MPKKKKKSKKFDKYYELYLKIILITPFVTLPIGSLFVFLYKPIAAFFGIIIMMCLALFVITVIITIIVQKILTLTRKYKDEDYTLDMFKTKLGKPYKYKFTFTTYNELIDYLLPRAKKKWYEYNCIKIKNKNTHIFERKITDYNRMNYNNFFVFYNTNKLSKELMDEIKNKVDIFIEENYGYTRRPNNIMFVIAVKEPNEYYNKFISEHVIHGCGISLKDKEITIVHQKDGDGIAEYRCIENYFPSFMNFQSKDKLQ